MLTARDGASFNLVAMRLSTSGPSTGHTVLSLLSHPVSYRFSLRSSARVLLGLVLLPLTSCTPSGDIVAKTTCQAAIATAIYTWQVEYYTNRTAGGLRGRRVADFQSARLVNRNGEKPAEAVTGPDDNGIWWPQLPSRPSADEVDAKRQPQEQNQPPELWRRVDYALQCADGDLSTDAQTYRQAARAFRAGQPVRVSYSLGRVLQLVSPLPSEVEPPPPTPSPTPTQPTPTQTTLYVDPQQGTDSGSGTATNPLRTISRAIAAGSTNSVIQLRPGSYSTTSGETFPLQLKPGMTLRGEPSNQGQQILLVGGGKFLSPTWAGQSVTIVASDRSRIEGLTITNPATRGTGIWVEAGQPTIAHNRFVDNNREGVFVSGRATPTIQQNRFEQNGGNGLSFTRDSGGLLENNTIRANGFGVAISDRAAPRLSQNTISGNLDGLVINGAARPVLSQNTISNNERDGIVVTQQAQLTLQQNTLRQNGEFDLHNATQRPLNLAERELVGLKVQGPVQ